MIWAEVLGDQLIHLKYLRQHGTGESHRKWDHWTCIVCQRDCPESEWARYPMRDLGPVDELGPMAGLFDYGETGWRAPHYLCRPNYEFGPLRKQSDHQLVPLTALRVCRQVYNEATIVLYSTNIFSFDDEGKSFDRFMRARTTRQKQLLRKLRLDMGLEQWSSWSPLLDMPLIRSLTGLRILRLQIDHRMKALCYSELRSQRGEENRSFFHSKELGGFVYRMATLPLTEVEVFVCSRIQPQRGEDVCWTVSDRKEYAEEMRRTLLDPTVAEKYALEQEETEEPVGGRGPGLFEYLSKGGFLFDLDEGFFRN